jgi:hypothetical protein
MQENDFDTTRAKKFILLKSAEKNVYLISRYLVRNFPKFLEKNKENKKLIKNSAP